MSDRKRGIICAYCGMAWGYEDESPTHELIKEACDHESVCEKNPYTAQIRDLRRECDELREEIKWLVFSLEHIRDNADIRYGKHRGLLAFSYLREEASRKRKEGAE